MTGSDYYRVRSELRTLHQRVNSLVHGSTSVTKRRSRLLICNGVEKILSIQMEIAETQLPRALTFRNDRAEEITLEVYSGRAVRILQPTSNYFWARLPESLMRDISESTTKQLSQLIATLKLFAAGTRELSVETRPCPQSKTRSSLGVSAENLFSNFIEKNAKCGSNTNHSQAFLSDFIESCAAFSNAALLMHGETFVVEYGDESSLEALKSIAIEEFSANDSEVEGQLYPTSSGQCIIYAGHPENGRIILCASYRQETSLVLLSQENLGLIYDLWKTKMRFGNLK